LLAIRLGLEVLVPESAGCNDDSHNMQAACHVERPLSALDACNGIGLAQLPMCAVWIDATNVDDALMWIEAVALVDTFDLNVVCHGPAPELPRPRAGWVTSKVPCCCLTGKDNRNGSLGFLLCREGFLSIRQLGDGGGEQIGGGSAHAGEFSFQLVHQRHQLVDLGHDAVLFGERW